MPLRLALLLALPFALQAGPYADPKVCARCHAAITESYAKTGMGRSFYAPRAANVIEDYGANNHYDHPASSTHYEMLQREGKFYQRRSQAGYNGTQTNIDEQRIDFVMGSGNHARTYLHRTPRGALLELPLAWYSEKGGGWGMNPGYDTLYNPQAGRAIGYECMFCHNAYPKIPAGQDRFAAEPLYTSDMPEGIDCQRCHGPAARHAALAQTAYAKLDDVRRAVLNPARLSAGRSMEVCMQCHLEPTSFRLPHSIKRYERPWFSYNPAEPLSSFLLFFDEAAGGPRDDRVEIASSAYRLRRSACFRESQGALQCTTCHNPHHVPHGPEAAAHYNGVCRQCHAASLSALVTAQKHTSAPDCTACHMPKRRTEDVVHVVVTDHYIQRTKPSRDLLAELPERVETNANAYQGQVLPYYPQRMQEPLYLAAAQVRDGSNLTAGIPQLTKILKATRPARPEPWYELAEALRNAKQWSKAVPFYREALARDAGYFPALLALGNTFKEANQRTEARAAFERATRDAPESPTAWNQLGQIEIDLGNLASAAGSLRKSIALEPGGPEPHNGLGIIFAQSGDFAGAERSFREAIRILPSSGEAHGNLANLLSAGQDSSQAAYEFEQALLFLPNDASIHFSYGAMLNGLRRFEDARVQIEKAVAANANFAEAHDLLGNLYERAARLDDALREYRAAVAANPSLSRAQLDLGAVLARTGDRAQAAEHLKQAATATDPNLRRMAAQLLQEIGAPP